MAEHGEFPTTPTGWQERQTQDRQAGSPPETEDGTPPARRRPDLGALIPGLLFMALAIVLMSPVDLPAELFDGVLVWIVVIVAGLSLLVSELRRSWRRRH